MTKRMYVAVSAIALMGTASAANAAPVIYNLTLTETSGNMGNGSGILSIEGANFSKVGVETFTYYNSLDKLLNLSFTIGSYTFGKTALALESVQFTNGTLTQVSYDGGAFLVSFDTNRMTYEYSSLFGIFGSSNGTISATPVAAPVPEPTTWAMMIGGFGAVGGAMRYRRRKTTVSFA